MAAMTAIYDGFLGLENSYPVLVASGDEYDSESPLVLTHSELFTG